MSNDPSHCMFCQGGLEVTADEPENLAFMEHVGSCEGCKDQFDAWRQNMQVDFLGD